MENAPEQDHRRTTRDKGRREETSVVGPILRLKNRRNSNVVTKKTCGIAITGTYRKTWVRMFSRNFTACFSIFPTYFYRTKTVSGNLGKIVTGTKTPGPLTGADVIRR